MAIMHPANIIEGAHVNSEEKFYNALKEQLNDRFHVFYSVRWYKLKDGKRETYGSDELRPS